MENFQISRRQFVQYVAGAAAAMGLSQTSVVKLTEQLSAGAWTKPEVLFVEGQNCGGCETSLAGLRHAGGHEVLDALGIPNTPSQMYVDGGASLMGSSTGGVLGGLLGGGSSSSTTTCAPTLEDNAWPEGDRYLSKNAVTIDDVAIDVLDIKVIRILGSQAGELYYDVLKQYLPGEGGTKKGHIAVFTGAFPLDGPNKIGEKAAVSAYSYKNEKEMPAAYIVRELSRNAKAVIAAGTCAAYGGIPAGANKHYNSKTGTYKSTGATHVKNVLAKAGITTPVVRVPNCPINPVAFFLTVAQLLADTTLDPANGMTNFKKKLDSDGRLKKFSVTIPPAQGSGAPAKTIAVDLYNQTIHGKKCPRYKFYAKSFYVSKFDQVGCFYYRGCKGPFTNAPCANGGPNGGFWNDWAGGAFTETGQAPIVTAGGNCIRGGHPCIGCAHKNHPFSPTIKY